MGVHGGCLGNDVLQAELQPFVKCDNSSSLQVHGLEHLLSGLLLVLPCLIQLSVGRGIAVFPRDGERNVDQLREGFFADQPDSVGQTWKNTKSLHNLNSIYFSYTGLFLGFTKEIAGKIKKFTQI